MDNPLDTVPPYPHELSFVVRLHRSASPSGAALPGRLVHLATGRQVDFTDFSGLQAALQSAVERILTPSE